MIKFFSSLCFLATMFACTNNRQEQPSSGVAPADSSGTPGTPIHSKKFLSRHTLTGFISRTPPAISPGKGKPFDSMDYNKVIMYEFEGRDESYLSVFDKTRQFIPVISKQIALSQQEADTLAGLLSDVASYGNGTAPCFVPHLAVVFYRDQKPVMDVSICLGCNSLLSSVPIPAETANKMNRGTDTEMTLNGFSIPARKTLRQLCDRYAFTYMRNNTFDK